MKLTMLCRDNVFRETFAEVGRAKALDVFESEKQFAELQRVLENL
jgi:hypothetical protein